MDVVLLGSLPATVNAALPAGFPRRRGGTLRFAPLLAVGVLLGGLTGELGLSPPLVRLRFLSDRGAKDEEEA